MPRRTQRRPARRAAPRRRARAPRSLAARVLVALVLTSLVAVPQLRAAVGRAGAVLAEALETSRLADARRVRVLGYAARYGIAPELAAEVERAALAEGIDPELGFRLVQVESEFHERAVSPAGALGLTQLMPATAAELQPGISREEIFQRATNLRLGFRYLRWLLRVHDGRVDEALHAYNRGPGTVARIRAAGGDPANGYARRVLGSGASAYVGSGLAE